MKYLFFPFRIIFRVWFYILVLLSMILLLPCFLILTSKESYYPKFWKFLRLWSYLIVYGSGFAISIRREEELVLGKSYMLCSNHSSLMDGFNFIISSKNPIVFVGKVEVAKTPVFGYFYNKVVITVDRSCASSRKSVYYQVKRKVDLGYSIGIFPEGKVPEEDVVLASFKNGPFSIAIQHQIPVVLQVSYDAKRLMSWDINKGHPGVFRIKQLSFLETKGLVKEDLDRLKDKAYNLIKDELLNDNLYMEDTLKAKKNKLKD